VQCKTAYFSKESQYRHFGNKDEVYTPEKSTGKDTQITTRAYIGLKTQFNVALTLPNNASH
jgi:hypothetical protein